MERRKKEKRKENRQKSGRSRSIIEEEKGKMIKEVEVSSVTKKIDEKKYEKIMIKNRGNSRRKKED